MLFNKSNIKSEYYIIQILSLNIKSISQRIQKFSQTRITNLEFKEKIVELLRTMSSKYSIEILLN